MVQSVVIQQALTAGLKPSEEAVTTEQSSSVEGARPRSVGERYQLSGGLEPLPQELVPALEVEPLPLGGDGQFAFSATHGESRMAFSLKPPVDGATASCEYAVLTYSPRFVSHAPRYIQVPKEAGRLWTGDRRDWVRRLVAMITAKAQFNYMPIVSYGVRVRTYPQEKYEELVIEVSVKASAKQALAFWDGLGATINRWQETLPANLKESLVSLITVSVIWNQK